MSKFLLLLDTPSIKKFVFGTDKLSEIAGASGLLDHLNRERTPQMMKKLSPDTIYCNGGKGLFVIESSKSKEEIEHVIQDLQETYRKETKGGAYLICSCVPYDEAHYQESLYQAHLELDENRTRHASTIASVHTPFMKECESCGQNPAKLKDRDQWICSVCAQKREMHKTKQIQNIWKELIQFLDETQDMEESRWYKIRPQGFEEIGSCYGSDRIGLIYADGNAMGKIIRELDSPEVTRFFSETVDTSLRHTCFEILKKICYDKQKSKMYGEILLLGGDDLVVVVPAEDAIEFALQISKEFQEKTKRAIVDECLKDTKVSAFFKDEHPVVYEKGLTISVGVVIGKVKQPFHMLLEQAEELLKFAKEKASQQSASIYHTQTYIDFHDATQSVFSNVEAMRKFYWMKIMPGQSCWKLTMRPYNTDDLQKLLNYAKGLKKTGWANSKLEDIRSACFETPRKLYHALISILSRVREDQHNALFSPLKEFHKAELFQLFLDSQKVKTEEEKKERELMLLDLLEVASYLTKENV